MKGGHSGYGIFKNKGDHGPGDILNNSLGRGYMTDFVSEHGNISNIDELSKYLNFVSDKITEYSSFSGDMSYAFFQ